MIYTITYISYHSRRRANVRLISIARISRPTSNGLPKQMKNTVLSSNKQQRRVPATQALRSHKSRIHTPQLCRAQACKCASRESIKLATIKPPHLDLHNPRGVQSAPLMWSRKLSFSRRCRRPSHVCMPAVCRWFIRREQKERETTRLFYSLFIRFREPPAS